MSRVLLHRPARVRPALPPADPLTVVLPPQQVQPPGGGAWFQLMLPMMTGLSGMMFMLYNPRPVYIVIGATMAIGSVGLSFSMYFQQRNAVRQKTRTQREQYREYLRRIAAQARRSAARQDAAARFVHPDQTGLWAVARGRVRIWERRPEDDDFAVARIGTGTVALRTPLTFQAEDGPFTERDKPLQEEADQLIAAHGPVPDQPLVLDLTATPSVSLVGPAGSTRAAAVRMLLELATFCAPEDLLIAVCHPAHAAAEWEWAKWLPHTRLEEGVALFPDGTGFDEVFGPELERRRERARRRTGFALDQRAGDAPRRLLLIVDGYESSRSAALADLAGRAAELNASMVFCVEAQRNEPAHVHARVRIDADESVECEAGGLSGTGRLDRVDPLLCPAIARALAPFRLEPEGHGGLGEVHRLVQLLGYPAAREVDVAELWQKLDPPYGVLRVPLGVDADGSPSVLDLKESALHGMGPHGLVIGATGSGKSELLRTLVTGLALTHPPDVLGFVLVDFKGGAAFAGLSELPHVAGMITNLADDLTMVERMRLALFGEQERRQHLLRQAGNIDNVREYQRRRAAGLLGDAPPLPYLLIVVDEFSELLSSRPDFIELFAAIGRLGRSLGMHLLLSSQRLDEGRLRGLESHLSYRICLRTFSAAESNAAIGSPEAYHLPPLPGSAYLKVDTSIFERFRAALVTAPDLTPDELPDETPRPTPFTAHGQVPEAMAAGPASQDAPSEMSVAVAQVLATQADPVHQVWLPPLPPRIPLSLLLPELRQHRTRGLQALSGDMAEAGGLNVPLGMADLPEEQRQCPFLVDFTGWAGHLVVVGAPQTGKSTLLRSLLLSMMATHTPAETHVYAIDYGGGSLFGLARAPHVGSVSGRLEPESVRRSVAQVWKLMDERDARFRELGVDSPATMRRLRAQRKLPAELGSDVFLVIDGYGAVREELDDLDPTISEIAARGLRVGVHLVLTANRWQEVRPQLRDNISGRLELRLGDPADSQIDRRAATAMPALPGRALNMGGDQVQVVLPDLGATLEEAVSAFAVAWKGAAAPPLRLLPAEVSFAELPAAGSDTAPGVPVGVDELDLAPVYLDLAGADSHFIVLGDAEAGKTTFLRTYLAGLQARQGADEAMFLVIDYRRTLLGAVRPEQTWAYCGAAPAAAAAVKELADGIVERLPPHTLSAEVLAERSWWSGPEFYVVVDDYDLVASPSGNPLMPLLDMLAQGRDLGLHVIVARRVGGMSRAGFEPVLGRLRELRQAGLIMSGDGAEGPLLANHRAAVQPPGRGLLVRRKLRPLLVQTARADQRMSDLAR